jgi:hypothetical protein
MNHTTIWHATFRPSLLEEREAFYRRLDPEQLRSYFAFFPSPPLFSIGVREIPDAEETDSLPPLVLYELEAQSIAQLVDALIAYAPESVYYNKNMCREPGECLACEKLSSLLGRACFTCPNSIGHEIVFDLDPENYACDRCGPLDDREIESFCPDCLRYALQDALRLHTVLCQEGFEQIALVYTGRGCHVHVHDPQTFTWSAQERERLIAHVESKSIQFDPFVTTGEMFLIRLPFSLHGLVHRVVTPVSKEELERALGSPEALGQWCTVEG